MTPQAISTRRRKAHGALQHQRIALQPALSLALLHPALNLFPCPLHVAFGANHPAAFQLFGIEDFPDDADFVLVFQLPEAQF